MRTFSFLSLLASLAVASSAVAETEKPNILFILIDDMGWMDLSCQGNKFVHTPNIDKFAKSGAEATRFDGVDWHAAPSGAPVLERAVAWIDCKIEQVYEMGDHYFVLGRVTSLDADADHDGLPPQPLVFYRGTIGGFAAEG